jgi:hypothetical protein
LGRSRNLTLSTKRLCFTGHLFCAAPLKPAKRAPLSCLRNRPTRGDVLGGIPQSDPVGMAAQCDQTPIGAFEAPRKRHCLPGSRVNLTGPVHSLQVITMDDYSPGGRGLKRLPSPISAATSTAALQHGACAADGRQGTKRTFGHQRHPSHVKRAVPPPSARGRATDRLPRVRQAPGQVIIPPRDQGSFDALFARHTKSASLHNQLSPFARR